MSFFVAKIFLLIFVVKHVVWFIFKWALIFFVAVQLWYLGWVLYYKYANPQQTSFMESRLLMLQKKNPKATLEHRWVDYSKISQALKESVVAAEDDTFVSHHGFDWDALKHAADRNLRRGTWKVGGSTITQQVAKNLFLSSERSFLRKGQEAIITVMLELVWDKRRILEMYLNIAQWGDVVYGAEAAARYYFHTSAQQLTPQEAARLAAMLPAPKKFSANPFSDYLTGRTEKILFLMSYAQVPR